MSELADFNFEIKYRHGKVNKAADTLSRLPLDINQYISICTRGTSQDVISAALSGVMALQNGDAVWITAVNSRNCHKIEPQVILAAQKQDLSIGRVLACKLNGRQPATREIANGLPYTRKLLREWPKLEAMGYYEERVDRIYS